MGSNQKASLSYMPIDLSIGSLKVQKTERFEVVGLSFLFPMLMLCYEGDESM